MVGQVFSHYRVLEKLGQGGMGEVYLAEDTALRRNVALKFLPAELASDPTACKRFLREARSAASLDHPYICHINEVARTEDGQDFIVMEYVEGQTVKDRLGEGPLPLKQALQVGVEVAEALEVAHQKGIIHRDLKPANIMLTPQGHAKIMDFGLAKKIVTDRGGEQDLTSALTRHGSALGTLAYMSPEQVKGQPLDRRSDIFSFGIVLYEMLTGVHPFRKAQLAETTAAILEHEPPSLSRYLDDAPEILQHAVRKMLAKNPDQRYQSAHEVRTDLDEQREISGSRAAYERRGIYALGRGVLWFLIAFPLVLLAVAGVILTSWKPLVQWGDETEASLNVVPFTTLPGFEEDPHFSPDGGRVVYCRQDPEAGNRDLYVQQIGPGDPIRLTDGTHYQRFPRWSPDGRVIAFARWLPERQRVAILTVPALGGAETTLTEVSINRGREPAGDFGVTGLSWAPDGKRLAISYRPEDEDEARVFLLSKDTGDMEAITLPPDGILGDFQAAFSPEGNLIAFFRRRDYASWDLYTQSLPDGKARPVTSRSFSSARGLAWRPDGRGIIFSAGPVGTELLWSVTLPEGDPFPLTGLGENVSKSWPALSAQGDRLAFSEMPAPRSDIWQVEGPDTRPKRIVASTRWDGRPSFSPDGTRLAFCSNRTGNMEIYVCRIDGSQIRQITELESDSGSPAWSPDGRQIAFDSYAEGDLNIHLASLEMGTPRRLTKHAAADGMAAWSRDGRWVYFHSNRSGEFQIWKMKPETGEAVQVTRNGGWYAQESFDGQDLYFQKADSSQIWRIPVDGGDELPVLKDAVHSWRWALTSKGIFFSSGEEKVEGWIMTVRFLDFTGDIIRPVFVSEVSGQPVGLAVSPNQQAFAFGLGSGGDNSDIMLVESFR